jgi:hypothetical protein
MTQHKQGDNQMQNYDLTQYCNDIAEEIARDASDIEQAMDWAHESADGSEYVIYYAKAHTICQNCNIEQGEDFFSECYGGEHGKSYDEIACIMAYGEINARICARLWEIFEEREEDAA